MSDFALTDRNDWRATFAALLVDVLGDAAARRGIEGTELGQLCDLVALGAIPEPPEPSGDDEQPGAVGL